MSGAGDAADGVVAAGDPARPTHPLRPAAAEASSDRSDRSKRRRRGTPPQQSTTGCHDTQTKVPDAGGVLSALVPAAYEAAVGETQTTPNNRSAWQRAVQATTISPVPEHSRTESLKVKGLMTSYNNPGLKESTSTPLRAIRVRTPSRAVIENVAGFTNAATAATKSSGKRRRQDPHRPCLKPPAEVGRERHRCTGAQAGEIDSGDSLGSIAAFGSINRSGTAIARVEHGRPSPQQASTRVPDGTNPDYTAHASVDASATRAEAVVDANGRQVSRKKRKVTQQEKPAVVLYAAATDNEPEQRWSFESLKAASLTLMCSAAVVKKHLRLGTEHGGWLVLDPKDKRASGAKDFSDAEDNGELPSTYEGQTMEQVLKSGRVGTPIIATKKATEKTKAEETFYRSVAQASAAFNMNIGGHIGKKNLHYGQGEIWSFRRATKEEVKLNMADDDDNVSGDEDGCNGSEEGKDEDQATGPFPFVLFNKTTGKRKYLPSKKALAKELNIGQGRFHGMSLSEVCRFELDDIDLAGCYKGWSIVEPSEEDIALHRESRPGHPGQETVVVRPEMPELEFFISRQRAATHLGVSRKTVASRVASGADDDGWTARDATKTEIEMHATSNTDGGVPWKFKLEPEPKKDKSKSKTKVKHEQSSTPSPVLPMKRSRWFPKYRREALKTGDVIDVCYKLNGQGWCRGVLKESRMVHEEDDVNHEREKGEKWAIHFADGVGLISVSELSKSRHGKDWIFVATREEMESRTACKDSAANAGTSKEGLVSADTATVETDAAKTGHLEAASAAVTTADTPAVLDVLHAGSTPPGFVTAQSPPVSEERMRNVATGSLLGKVPETDSRESLCDICMLTLKDEAAVAAHASAEHLDISPYACPVCKVTFKDLSEIEAHTHENNCGKSKVKTKARTLKGVSEIECEGCRKTFGSALLLAKHEAITHRDTRSKWPCDFVGCGRKFNGRRSLEKHKNTHEGGGFACDRCGEKFSAKEGLDLYHVCRSAKRKTTKKNVNVAGVPTTSALQMFGLESWEHLTPEPPANPTLNKHRYAVFKNTKLSEADMQQAQDDVVDLDDDRYWEHLSQFGKAKSDPNRSQRHFMVTKQAPGPWLEGLGMNFFQSKAAREAPYRSGVVEKWDSVGRSVLCRNDVENFTAVFANEARWDLDGRGAGAWLVDNKIRVLDKNEDDNRFYNGNIDQWIPANPETGQSAKVKVDYAVNDTRIHDLRNETFELLEPVDDYRDREPGAWLKHVDSIWVHCKEGNDFREGKVTRFESEGNIAHIKFPEEEIRCFPLDDTPWRLQAAEPNTPHAGLTAVVEAATATIKAHGLVGSNLLSRDGCYILQTHEVAPRKKKGQKLHLDSGRDGIPHAFGAVEPGKKHCVPLSVVIPMTGPAKFTTNPTLTRLIQEGLYYTLSRSDKELIQQKGNVTITVKYGELLVFCHDFVHAGAADEPNMRVFLSFIANDVEPDDLIDVVIV